MVLIDPGLPFARLTVERFDYTPLNGEWGDWAVLKLLAALGGEPGALSVAHLMIDPGDGGERFSAAAETCAIERRLRPGESAEFEALWSATFSVPLQAVETASAVFTLLAGERHPVAVALPAPLRHDAFNPILSLRQRRPARQRALSARQIAAVATTVALTATSVPAAALATDVTTPTATAAPAIATVTTTTASTTAPATTGTTPATTPAAPAAPTAAPASHHPARHTSTTRHTAHRAAPASRASTRTITGVSGCATTDTAGPIAYAAGGHSSAAGTHLSCSVKPKSASPPVGASISFGSTRSASSASSASTTTTPTTPTSTTTSATSTTTATTPTPQPGTPTPTPVRHHAAPAAHRPGHHAAHHSTGGASLAPTAPRSTSTPAPQPTSSSTSVTTLSTNPPGFSGPQSWTGTVAANPALTGAVTELSGLLSNGNRPPSFLIPIYMEAGHRYHVPWEVLAAINAIETDYGRDLNTSSAGAVGWMQFEPSTWAQYGMAVDGHSVPNPYDPRDAIFSAARYLAAAGAAQDVSRAVFSYNHASWYVDEVMSRAQAISSHAQFERATVQHGKFAVYFATAKKANRVRYTGGVLSHYDRLIAAANMVSAANFPYVWGGGHTQPARFGPFDCSGSVSYVMQQAGYKVPTSVSGNIGQWKFPAGPGQVTIFYNPTHTFMRIGDRYFGTSGFARPGGGAGWFNVDKLPASYLANFSEVHVPNLGPNSFDGSQAPLIVTPLFTHHRHRQATSTLSFMPLMSTLGPFPGTSTLPALPS